MSPGRTAIAGALTLGLALATAALSNLRVDLGGANAGAAVRLSWRLEPIRVEECRPLSAEEQARLPAHMRRTEECTGDFVDYELDVAVDGVHTVDTLSPSGLRRDRPVYVLVNRSVSPGTHGVDVTFRALLPEGARAEGPARLTWSGEMELEPGEVGLITLGDTGDALLRVDGPG